MKKLLAILLALALVCGLAACTGKTTPTDTPTEKPTEAPSETTGDATEAPTDAAEDHTFETEYWANLKPEDVVTWNAPNNYKKVGMIVPDGANEFYVTMCTTAEKIFENAGYSFVWTGATDSESAINAIDTWVTQGVDALILLVQDTACENAALNAMKQGVLVVLGSATFSSYHVWCCQEYYQIGYNIADMASKDMKEKFGDDASYILLGGTKAEFHQQKTNGLRDGMAALYPNGTCYEVIDSSNYQDDVETLLTQHPEVKAIVSWHASLSLQGLAALNTLNMNNPKTFAVYGSQMTAQSALEIANPNSCYVADTWMGDQGKQYANVVLTLLNGGSVNHWDYAPDFVVNADNIDTYYEDYYAAYGDTFLYN